MNHERRATIEAIQAPRARLDAAQSAEDAWSANSQSRCIDLHDSVQRALRAVACDVRIQPVIGAPDAYSREALDVVCELARRDQLLIEQLLVLLKEAWHHLPEVQSLTRREASVTLTTVVTHCIKEFYRPSRRS